MTCMPDKITFSPSTLSCNPAPMYHDRKIATLAEEVLPYGLRKVVDAMTGLAPTLMHKFLDLEICSAQIHALCLGLFASFAAPFGGFLSSAIKRAYGIKDFNNLIPGHGGMMDRFDCQFVMFLCTFVHIRTFCQAPVTVEMLLASAAALNLGQRQELLRRLEETLNVTPTL